MFSRSAKRVGQAATSHISKKDEKENKNKYLCEDYGKTKNNEYYFSMFY